jgi:hypothetical protein
MHRQRTNDPIVISTLDIARDKLWEKSFSVGSGFCRLKARILNYSSAKHRKNVLRAVAPYSFFCALCVNSFCSTRVLPDPMCGW